ncbi:MAG: methyltransferase domain-containing protein, partial [Candidatus Omnitrophota bacterium]
YRFNTRQSLGATAWEVVEKLGTRVKRNSWKPIFDFKKVEKAMGVPGLFGKISIKHAREAQRKAASSSPLIPKESLFFGALMKTLSESTNGFIFKQWSQKPRILAKGVFGELKPLSNNITQEEAEEINSKLNSVRKKILAEQFFRERDFSGVEVEVLLNSYRSASFKESRSSRQKNRIQYDLRSFKNTDFLYLETKHELFHLKIKQLHPSLDPALAELFILLFINIRGMINLKNKEYLRSQKVVSDYQYLAHPRKGLFKFYKVIINSPKVNNAFEFLESLCVMVARETAYFPAMRAKMLALAFDKEGRLDSLKLETIKILLHSLKQALIEEKNITEKEEALADFADLAARNGLPQALKPFMAYARNIRYKAEDNNIFLEVKFTDRSGLAKYAYIYLGRSDDLNGTLSKGGRIFNWTHRKWQQQKPGIFYYQDPGIERQKEEYGWQRLIRLPVSRMIKEIGEYNARTGRRPVEAALDRLCQALFSKLGIDKTLLSKKTWLSLQKMIGRGRAPAVFYVIRAKYLNYYLDMLYPKLLLGEVKVSDQQIKDLAIWPVMECSGMKSSLVNWLGSKDASLPGQLYLRAPKIAITELLALLASSSSPINRGVVLAELMSVAEVIKSGKTKAIFSSQSCVTAEIAQETGLSESWIKKEVSRVSRALEQRLGRFLSFEDIKKIYLAERMLRNPELATRRNIQAVSGCLNEIYSDAAIGREEEQPAAVSLEALAAEYDEIARAGWGNSGKGTYSVIYRDYRIYLADIIGEAKSILSLGCGTGELEELLIARGNKVTGLDISKGMIEAFKARCPLAQAIVANAGEDLSALFDQESFDAVIFPESIGHMDIPSVLQGACRLLKDKGMLIITSYFPSDIPGSQLIKSYRRLAPSVLAKIVEDAEFKVIKKETRDFEDAEDSRNYMPGNLIIIVGLKVKATARASSALGGTKELIDIEFEGAESGRSKSCLDGFCCFFEEEPRRYPGIEGFLKQSHGQGCQIRRREIILARKMSGDPDSETSNRFPCRALQLIFNSPDNSRLTLASRCSLYSERPKECRVYGFQGAFGHCLYRQLLRGMAEYFLVLPGDSLSRSRIISSGQDLDLLTGETYFTESGYNFLNEQFRKGIQAVDGRTSFIFLPRKDSSIVSSSPATRVIDLELVRTKLTELSDNWDKIAEGNRDVLRDCRRPDEKVIEGFIAGCNFINGKIGIRFKSADEFSAFLSTLNDTVTKPTKEYEYARISRR